MREVLRREGVRGQDGVELPAGHRARDDDAARPRVLAAGGQEMTVVVLLAEPLGVVRQRQVDLLDGRGVGEQDDEHVLTVNPVPPHGTCKCSKVFTMFAHSTQWWPPS